MRISTAAAAAWRPWLVVTALLAPVVALGADEPLTFEHALVRVIEHHPSLQVLDLGRAALEAEAAQAALRPALTVGAEVENVAGTGELRGIDGAEWTLSLAGTLERGGKRALREAVAARRIDAQATRRAAAALALMTETAQRYLDVAAAREDIAIADSEARERDDWARLARQRSSAGAIPQVVPLMAEAAAAQARFERDRARLQQALAEQRLASLWGGSAASIADVDLYALPAAPDLPALIETVERNPSILALSDETRLREAQLRVAEASRIADPSWRAGIRRVEATNDLAVVADVTLPLQSRARAEPLVRAQRAELDAIAFERGADERRLASLVLEAHGVYVASRLTAERLRDDVLPRYDAASDAAARAWQSGALSPLEWSGLQDARFNARRARLAAAIAARRALIELQSLTAEPLR